MQLTLTRLFSATLAYHFAFMAISLALLGSGASGVAVYLAGDRLDQGRSARWLSLFALGFAASTVIALVVTLGSRFSPLEPPLVLFRRVSVLYLAAAVPFLFAGAAISLAVARRAGEMSRLYLFDLGGAAAGCLLLIPLLDHAGAPSAVLVVSVLAVAAAAVFASAEPMSRPFRSRPRRFRSRRRRAPGGQPRHRECSTCATPRDCPRPAT